MSKSETVTRIKEWIDFTNTSLDKHTARVQRLMDEHERLDRHLDVVDAAVSEEFSVNGHETISVHLDEPSEMECLLREREELSAEIERESRKVHDWEALLKTFKKLLPFFRDCDFMDNSHLWIPDLADLDAKDEQTIFTTANNFALKAMELALITAKKHGGEQAMKIIKPKTAGVSANGVQTSVKKPKSAKRR